MKARHLPYLVEGLEQFVRDCPSGRMAEVGVFIGESTEIFAKSGKFTEIVAVDLWQNGYDHRDPISRNADMAWAEQEFETLALSYPAIQKIKLDSVEAAQQYEDHYFDLVYLDANHTYEGVVRDLRAWKDKVKPGGWLAGHDYKVFAGVTKAVNRLGKEIQTWRDFSWAVKMGT